MNRFNEAIFLHNKAIQWMFLAFSKGKFLLYFLPGLIISFPFWGLSDWTATMSSDNYADSDGWFGSILNSSIQGFFSFLGFLFEQLKIFLVITLLSPLFTRLSESVEESLTGKKFKFDLVQFIEELIRMLAIVFIALSLEFITLGIYHLFSWIFGLGFLDGIANFCIASFFYGFAFYDYCLERHQIGIFQSVSFVRQKPILNFVTGLCFGLASLIPVFGFAVAPVIATIIASHVFVTDNNSFK
ncbi:MAG: hypothetical protein N4A41_10365 [Crocinitomicaceae bacterium]|jgi:CysZ protein|nr:hypothetical protein [Crocinitomicaceae bacterium]